MSKKNLDTIIECVIEEEIYYMDKKSALLSSKYDVTTYDPQNHLPQQYLPLEPFFSIAKRDRGDIVGLTKEQLISKCSVYGDIRIYNELERQKFLRKEEYAPKSLGLEKQKKTQIYFPTEKAIEKFLKKRRKR